MHTPGRRTSVSALFFLSLGLLVGQGKSVSAQSLTGPALAQANRVADNADLNIRAQVTGHIPAWATPAADAGAVANDAPQLLTFDVARSPEVQAAFEQLLADQQNPHSPQYHQWLTPQQIGDQFGPTQHDLDAFTAWLTSAGFTVSNITPSRIFVQATAPASVVSSALQVSLHSFTVSGNKLQAPLTEPSFPAALAPMVRFVSGLATVQYRTFSTVMPLQPISILGTAAGATPAVHADYTLGSGTVHYLAPADFNLIYDVTPTLTAGITGSGYRVAIIGGSRLLASDLTTWESISALTSYQPNYIVPSGLTDPGITSDGNQGEGTLDFERVYGTAPGVQVDQVISKNWLSTDTDTLQLYAINTLNDPVLTMSYGACEAGQASYAQHENTLFSQAIAQGISVFASSGDSGIAGCDTQGVAPPATQSASIQVPCDSVYLTCVGGTQFSDTASPGTYWSATNGTGKLSALSYIPEGAWNEPTYTTSAGATAFQVASSTGGPSTAITKPSWQVGTTIPADSVRDTPDISFSASGHNAYFSCLSYAGADCTTYVTGFGGTSASAPSMAGLAALIDQKLGKRQGLLNPILYSTATSTPSAFHDATPATSGVASCSTATPSTCNNSNAAPASLTGGIAGYPLLVGYDFPTGLGSLDFGKFLTAISLPTPTIAVTATPSTITISQTVVFTAKLTGGTTVPTGTVQFTAIATAFGSPAVALGGPIALVNGSASTTPQSFSPAATYTITATYSGDTNYSSNSGTYALGVTNPNAIAASASLTISPSPGTTLQSTTLTATVKGSGTAIPTGTVTFFDSGTLKALPVTLERLRCRLSGRRHAQRRDSHVHLHLLRRQRLHVCRLCRGSGCRHRRAQRHARNPQPRHHHRRRQHHPCLHGYQHVRRNSHRFDYRVRRAADPHHLRCGFARLDFALQWNRQRGALGSDPRHLQPVRGLLRRFHLSSVHLEHAAAFRHRLQHVLHPGFALLLGRRNLRQCGHRHLLVHRLHRRRRPVLHAHPHQRRRCPGRSRMHRQRRHRDADQRRHRHRHSHHQLHRRPLHRWRSAVGWPAHGSHWWRYLRGAVDDRSARSPAQAPQLARALAAHRPQRGAVRRGRLRRRHHQRRHRGRHHQGHLHPDHHRHRLRRNRNHQHHRHRKLAAAPHQKQIPDEMKSKR